MDRLHAGESATNPPLQKGLLTSNREFYTMPLHATLLFVLLTRLFQTAARSETVFHCFRKCERLTGFLTLLARF